MKRYALGEFPADYAPLTPAEQLAWHNPQQGSYHSLHVERMGHNTFRWRDSQTAHYYIGNEVDLQGYIWTQLTCRKVDPDYESRQVQNHILTILSQEEVDDLFSDL